MSDDTRDIQREAERVRRVSDTLCTAHAALRDRYTRRALWLDLAVLGLSTWLVALAFVEPRINLSLTPFGIDPQIWVGLIGVVTFLLVIVQVKADWKGRADAHDRSFTMYAEVKRECGYLLASGADPAPAEWRRILARYDVATDVGITIPEREFLRQKRRHTLKVAVSRHLDDHPAASILLTKLRFFVRDNLWSRKSPNDRES